MMDGNASCGCGGLIADAADLVENMSFWNMAFSGVSPHVHHSVAVDPLEPNPQHHHHHQQHLDLDPMEHHHQQHLDLVDQQPARRELFAAVESDPRLDPFLGMEFDSGEAAKTFYIAYAGRVGFSVCIARSRRSKCNESVIMLRFVCSREVIRRWRREEEAEGIGARARVQVEEGEWG